MADPASQPKRGLRFSLLNLLLLTTIVALSFQILIQNRNYNDLVDRTASIRNENARLRAERGELTIDDEDKAYAIRLPCFPVVGDLTWTYRVYLPPGDEYFVAGMVNNLPTGNYLPIRIKGRPPGTSTISSAGIWDGIGTSMGLRPGKYLLTVAIFQEEGEWSYRLAFKDVSSDGTFGGGVGGSVVRAKESEWPVADDFSSAATGGVREKQLETDLNQGLILLDYRRLKSVPGSSSSDSPYGALVWIDRVSNYEEE